MNYTLLLIIKLVTTLYLIPILSVTLLATHTQLELLASHPWSPTESYYPNTIGYISYPPAAREFNLSEHQCLGEVWLSFNTPNQYCKCSRIKFKILDNPSGDTRLRFNRMFIKYHLPPHGAHMWGISPLLYYSVLRVALWDKYQYPNSTFKEIEAQKRNDSSSHGATWKTWSLNLRPSISSPDGNPQHHNCHGDQRGRNICSTVHGRPCLDYIRELWKSVLRCFKRNVTCLI